MVIKITFLIYVSLYIQQYVSVKKSLFFAEYLCSKPFELVLLGAEIKIKTHSFIRA